MTFDKTSRRCLNYTLALIAALTLAQAAAGQEEPPEEDEAGKWEEVREYYKRTKEKAIGIGETLPEKMPDWVKEDLKNAGSWEYRVVETPRAELEVTLNELGAERWECFAVESAGKKSRLVLKRRKRSRLREIDSLSAEDLLAVMKLLRDRVWEEPDG